MIDSTLSSISTGFFVSSLKIAEDSSRKEVSWFGAWLFQGMQMSKALEFSQLALSAVGSTKIMTITNFH